MNSPKIFLMGLYSFSEILSGPEKVAKRIFSEFLRRHIDVVFIEYFFEGTKFSLWQKLFGKEFIHIGFNVQVLRLGIFQIAIELWKKKPKIVHVINFSRFQLVSFILRPFVKYKIIYTVHGIKKYELELTNSKVMSYNTLKDKAADYVYTKFCDRLFFLSESSLKLASKYFKIDDARVRIVTNGIDEQFHKAWINRTINNRSKPKGIFIGDSDRIEKGLEFLLECLYEINYSLELYIIGTGYKSNYFKNNNNFEVIIVNKMPTDELSEFYKDKDIFFSASFYDSFSIAAAEAIAAGLVPVVSNQTGISRFIENGKNGFVFNYGDKTALIEIINSLVNNSEILKSISSGARLIYETLKWEKISDLYLSLYND
jgi:glycosyltransferase involved in cell wall biosynthesis